MIAIIQNYLENPKVAFIKIDDFFNALFSNGAIVNICKNLVDLQDSYHFKIINHRKYISIIFGEFFFERGIYKITFSNGRVIVSSASPVYLPQKIETMEKITPAAFLSTPHTFALPDGQEPPSPKMLFFSLKPTICKCPRVLIGFLRDVTIYTQLLTVWNPLMKLLSSIGINSLTPRLHFNAECSSMSMIVIGNDAKMPSFVVTIDQFTGEMFFKTQLFSLSLHKFIFAEKPIFLFVKKVIAVIIQILFSSTYRFTCHIKQDPNQDLKYLIMGFSYAPGFRILHKIIRGNTKLEVIGLDGNVFYSPYFIHYVKVQSPIELMDDIDKCFKKLGDFVFILQLEYLFKEKGYTIERTISSIVFTNRIFDAVQITANNGVWRVKFHTRATLLHRFIRVSEINGMVHTANSPEVVLNIVEGFTKYIDVVAHTTFGFVKEITKSSSNPLVYNNCIVSSGSFNISGEEHGLEIIFADHIQSISHNKLTKSHEISACSVPRTIVTMKRENPIRNALKRIDISSISSSSKLSAFLVHSMVPLIHTVNFTKRDGWQMICSDFPSVFQLIYQGKYTFSIELKTMHVFSVCISSNLPNGAAVVPFISTSVIKQIIPSRKTFRIRYPMKEFFTTFQAFELYIKRYEDTVNAGFMPLSIDTHPVPRAVLMCNGIVCSVDAKKTTLKYGDPKVNEALENMPKTLDSMRLMTLITNKHTLMIFVARLLTALYKFNKSEFETAAATAYYGSGKIYLNINGFPFEINGVTASCGELAFRGDTMNEIEKSIMSILR
jgi:hypothetical protein